MELKKSHRANLEKRRTVNFIIGLLVSLSLILISFEWTTMTTSLEDVNRATEISPDVITLAPIPREQPKPPAKPELPPIATVLELVDEDPIIDPILWNPEFIPGTEISIPSYLDEGPEVLAGPAEAVENRVSGRVIVKFVLH